jgi:hypothetical protein
MRVNFRTYHLAGRRPIFDLQFNNETEKIREVIQQGLNLQKVIIVKHAENAFLSRCGDLQVVK